MKDRLENEVSEQPLPEKTPATKPANERIMMWVWILLGVCAALALFVYIEDLPPPLGMYDALAKCIASTTTEFYGAWWCPHCRAQKTKFGDAAQYLPYIECATPDGDAETQVCINAGIKNYPTWQFPDGSRLVGVLSPATISQKTGCPLPTSTRS